MKIIAYARVSSPKVNGKSRQKTDSQIHAIKRYCKDRNLSRVQIVTDHATGRNSQREGLTSILNQVQQGQVSDLIVWKLDRLSRSLTDMVRTFETLLGHGCTLHVVSQALVMDARSPMTDFLVGLFGLLGRLESDLISERIKSGLAVRKSKGLPMGAKVKVKQRQKIQRYLDRGLSQPDIARRLKISRQAVYNMVKRMKESA